MALKMLPLEAMTLLHEGHALPDWPGKAQPRTILRRPKGSQRRACIIEANEIRPRGRAGVRRRARATQDVHDHFRPPDRAPLYGGRSGGLALRARRGRSRRVPLHARDSSKRLSRQALDDAAVRRVWHARGNERALQAAARGCGTAAAAW